MTKDINAELERMEKKAALTSGASWAKFPTVGANIQGTLITRRLAMSPTQQEQIIYVIKNADGIFNVAFNSRYPIHKDFEGAVVGQVFRVTLASEKKHSKPGFNPIKIYSVVTAPDLIDNDSKEWLEENGFELGAAMPALEGIPEFEDSVATEISAEELAKAKPISTSIPHVEAT